MAHTSSNKIFDYKYFQIQSGEDIQQTPYTHHKHGTIINILDSIFFFAAEVF